MTMRPFVRRCRRSYPLGQKRCATTGSVLEQERIEFALDELLRRPEAIGDPQDLLDSALAHARSKIRRRAAIVPFYPVGEPPDMAADPAGQAEQALIDAVDMVASVPLTRPDRALLLFALADFDAGRYGGPSWAERHVGPAATIPRPPPRQGLRPALMDGGISHDRRYKYAGQLPLIVIEGQAVQDKQVADSLGYRAGPSNLPPVHSVVQALAPQSARSSTATTAALPASSQSGPGDPTRTTDSAQPSAGCVPAKEACAMTDSTASAAADRSAASFPPSGSGGVSADESPTAQIIQIDKALESWRDAGFDLNTAIGEVVDNSIEAAATRIRIRTYPKGEKPKIIDTIAFSDDGDGIDAGTLPHVLTLGYSSRYEQRSGLGRFGVGLKLAALSHARRLDIYTRQLGDVSVLHAWLDLDDIATGTQRLILSEKLPEFPAEHADLVRSADGDLRVRDAGGMEQSRPPQDRRPV